MNDITNALKLAIAALEGEGNPTVAILACEQALMQSSPKALWRVIYSSSSLVSPEGLKMLFRQARANNVALGVTGWLAHSDGLFVQLLEGPKETVIGLMQTIRDDPRHRQFALLDSRSIAEREYGEWLMASLELHPEDFASLMANLESSPHRLLNKKIAKWMTATKQ